MPVTLMTAVWVEAGAGSRVSVMGAVVMVTGLFVMGVVGGVTGAVSGAALTDVAGV